MFPGLASVQFFLIAFLQLAKVKRKPVRLGTLQCRWENLGTCKVKNTAALPVAKDTCERSYTVSLVNFILKQLIEAQKELHAAYFTAKGTYQ